MNGTELAILLLALAAVVVYLIVTHKINTASITAKLSAFEAAVHGKLDSIHAVALAPVSVVQAPQPAATTPPADTAAVIHAVAAVVSAAQPKPDFGPLPPAHAPSVTDLLYRPDAATAAILDERANRPAAPASTEPFDFWKDGRWNPGLLAEGQTVTTPVNVPEGFAGTVYFGFSYPAGEVQTWMDEGDKGFGWVSWPGFPSGLTPGTHILSMTATKATTGSVNINHTP